MPFFLLLSVVAIGIVLGPIAGAVLVVLGLLLIGVSHLPVAFSTRVLLLCLIGGALAAVRAGWLEGPSSATSSLGLSGVPKMVLPVLGSMFMFRLIIYLYDLRHEERARVVGDSVVGVQPVPAVHAESTRVSIPLSALTAEDALPARVELTRLTVFADSVVGTWYDSLLRQPRRASIPVVPSFAGLSITRRPMDLIHARVDGDSLTFDKVVNITGGLPAATVNIVDANVTFKKKLLLKNATRVDT